MVGLNVQNGEGSTSYEGLTDALYKSDKVKDDETFQKGLASMQLSPHQDFQFNMLHEGAEENFMKWFNGDDTVRMLCKWDDLGKGFKAR